MVRFKLCLRGVGFEIIGVFVFKKWRFLGQVYRFAFWGFGVWIVFNNLNFRIKYFEFKPIYSKPQKVSKRPKSYSHQSRGHMEYFKKYQNSWPRYRNSIFCVTFQNMYRWIIFQIKGAFFVFLKVELFWDESGNSLFEIRL